MPELPQILSRLRNEATRWDAILELKVLRTPDLAGDLIPLLRDQEWFVRWAVAEKLGDLGDDQAIRALIPLMSDPDKHVRKNASKALKKFGFKAASDVALQLRHRDVKVRVLASEILVGMGPSIVNELERLLPDQHWVAANRIIDVLWRIGGKPAEGVLIRAVGIEDVQKNAIVYLGFFKPKDAIPALISAYQKPKLRRLALFALTEIGRPALDHAIKILSLPHTDKESVLKLIEILGPKPAMERIHALATKDIYIRNATAEWRRKYPPAVVEAKPVKSGFLGLFG